MGKGYLSYTMALILQALDNGYRHGFDVMTITGLPSGTVYPALRRLEEAGLVKSKWEKQSVAQAEQRTARCYYELTKAGNAMLVDVRQRFRLKQFDAPSILKPTEEGG